MRARRVALVPVGPHTKKGTAPARGVSPSAHSRGETCQLRPPPTSLLSCSTRDRANALAASRELAHHENLLRLRAVPGWFWSVRPS